MTPEADRRSSLGRKCWAGAGTTVVRDNTEAQLAAAVSWVRRAARAGGRRSGNVSRNCGRRFRAGRSQRANVAAGRIIGDRLTRCIQMMSASGCGRRLTRRPIYTTGSGLSIRRPCSMT